MLLRLFYRRGRILGNKSGLYIRRSGGILEICGHERFMCEKQIMLRLPVNTPRANCNFAARHICNGHSQSYEGIEKSGPERMDGLPTAEDASPKSKHSRRLSNGTRSWSTVILAQLGEDTYNMNGGVNWIRGRRSITVEIIPDSTMKASRKDKSAGKQVKCFKCNRHTYNLLLKDFSKGG